MHQSSDATTRPGTPPWGELLDLAEAMRDLADRATTAEGLPALDDLANLAVERVPSARWASLTVLRAKKFRTEETTDESATRADILQYGMGFGPASTRCGTTPSTSVGTWSATAGGRSGEHECPANWGCAASSRSACA